MARIIDAERLARGNREADPAFHDIKRVAGKFGAGAASAEAIYGILERAHEEAASLSYASARSPQDDQIRVRLAALQRDTLEQVREGLGSQAALELLMDQIGYRHHWLREALRLGTE